MIFPAISVPPLLVAPDAWFVWFLGHIVPVRWKRPIHTCQTFLRSISDRTAPLSISSSKPGGELCPSVPIKKLVKSFGTRNHDTDQSLIFHTALLPARSLGFVLCTSEKSPDVALYRDAGLSCEAMPYPGREWFEFGPLPSPSALLIDAAGGAAAVTSASLLLSPEHLAKTGEWAESESLAPRVNGRYAWQGSASEGVLV